jgi:hypothetical protein
MQGDQMTANLFLPGSIYHLAQLLDFQDDIVLPADLPQQGPHIGVTRVAVADGDQL